LEKSFIFLANPNSFLGQAALGYLHEVGGASQLTDLSSVLLFFTSSMSSYNSNHSETTAANLSSSRMPTEFLLSLAVGPLLLGVLATDAIFSWLQSTGISSEEVFRGERLPVLHFPDSATQE
jgi:hypothetical protein